MMRHSWVFSACVTIAAPTAWAQEAKPAAPAAAPLPADVKALLEKVDKTIYNAQGAGMKDLSYSMVLPMLAQMGINDPIKVYWKAPDKAKVELPDALAQMMGGSEMADMQKKQMQKKALITGDSYASQLDGYSATLEKDGELSKITATTTDTTKGTTQTILWIDSNNLVVKTHQKLNQTNPMMPAELEQTITYRKEGDRYLPIELKSGEQGSAKFEYAQVNGFWFPSKLTQESAQSPMGPMQIEFKDVKVNSGIDDSFFKNDKPAASTPPDKKG
ncbi:MAG: hypothetical protein HY292_22470 [Planctomycetes bacterium]|nr:hypothetical protein [Planctomycetota bacterium]